MEKMKLVVPTIPQDIGKLLENIGIYFNFLPIKEICVIGGGKVEALLPQNYPIVFIDENELVDFDAIKNLIVKRTRNNEAGKRAGWYVQQFIKMGFARTCPDDFYLLWDSDTVPLKPVNMLEAGNPIFDCKTEYHEPYFKTIEKLFPNLKKCIEGSFISEHMIIKTSLMRQMLNEIEANVALEGDNFAEKIINAVPVEDLGKSGFSEFETFGTYVQSKFPDEYSLREWKSLRCGGLFFDGALSATTVSWLARYYDAISFENWDELSRACKIVSSSWYEKLFRANTLEVWAFFVRVYRRIRERKVR
jgi:hypothetical protein